MGDFLWKSRKLPFVLWLPGGIIFFFFFFHSPFFFITRGAFRLVFPRLCLFSRAAKHCATTILPFYDAIFCDLTALLRISFVFFFLIDFFSGPPLFFCGDYERLQFMFVRTHAHRGLLFLLLLLPLLLLLLVLCAVSHFPEINFFLPCRNCRLSVY